jgi:cyclopropane fatty-acyl-phospholipid synthase-like methyltransferase
MDVKPHSEACDRNRDPILKVIRPVLAGCSAVLEIGSGTGQHAVYFAAAMPHLVWHPSDREEYLPGIRLWIEEAGLPNLRPPLGLDVNAVPWRHPPVDAVFSANTAHIMHWPEVRALIAGVGALLPPGGAFLLYGPFNYNGRYTSDSNRHFDAWLKARDPDSGIRPFEDVDALATEAGLTLQRDVAMPANNRILYWRKPAEPAKAGS